MITSLVPKLRLEMIGARSDTAGVEFFAESAPPTTILIGEKTLVAPLATARQLAPVLQAKTFIVPGAGHMIPLTHVAAVVDAVQREVTA